MKIIIIGAGQVGQTVMNDLFDDHSVVLVDRDSAVLDEVPYDVDVVAGDGVEQDVLKQAGLKDADIVITTTASDQINLLISNTVKALSDCYTIARVSDPSFQRTWETTHGAFGVDKLVGRADLTAREITELVGLQSTPQEPLSEEMFCDGQVKMAEFELTDQSPLVGHTLGGSLEYSGVTFGSVASGGEFQLASADRPFEAGDRVAVFGSPGEVDAFGIDIAPSEESPIQQSIDILGGGNIGFRTAVLLDNQDFSVRVFEKNPERAQYLSEQLNDPLVLRADATKRKVWDEERLDESELILISTGDDAQNSLITLMGQEFEASRLVSVVDERQNLSLFESLGITQIIHPREVVASNIIDHVRDSYADNLTMLEHERGEVFEIKLDDDSPAVGKTIKELDKRLNQNFVIAALVRHGQARSLDGDTTLQSGDRLIIMTTADQSEEIAEAL